MKIKHLMILLTVISLAAAGCQRIEKAGSDEESVPKESVNAPEESTGNAEPETEQQTGPEKETVPEDKPIELVYELEPNQEYYFFGVARENITKDGDVYYLTGDKTYAGPIVLSWEQKALLDAGAELKIMYEGKEVDRIKSTWGRKGDLSGDCIRYNSKYDYGLEAFLLTSTPRDESSLRYYKESILPYVDLDDPQYGGIGFYFTSIPPFHPYISLKIEENVVLEISGDTEVRPRSDIFDDYKKSPDLLQELASRIWTFDEYYKVYEAAEESIKKYGVGFEIYEEEGNVVYMREFYGG